MRKSKLTILAILVFFLSLIFLFAGISYSIFSYFGKGMTNNMIHTGKIIFSYSDANGGGNGIHIEDALPISDEVGKVLSSEGEYFDFTIFASTVKTNLSYEITVQKNDNSTLDENFVKVYLTTFEGGLEIPVGITFSENQVSTFNLLKDTLNHLLTGKTVYYGNVQAGEVAYGKKFRLRLWVKDPNTENFDYSNLSNKFFSVKVNVAATGVS